MKSELQNAPATRKDIDEVIKLSQNNTDKAITLARKDTNEVLDVLRGFIQQSSERFTQIDNRFDMLEFKMNARFDKLESKIVNLEKSHDKLLCTIDKFLARIDTYETEQTARDSQFNKLLEWARKVSAKTGIPLENL